MTPEWWCQNCWEIGRRGITTLNIHGRCLTCDSELSIVPASPDNPFELTRVLSPDPPVQPKLILAPPELPLDPKFRDRVVKTHNFLRAVPGEFYLILNSLNNFQRRVPALLVTFLPSIK